jgi:hypothetical protein
LAGPTCRARCAIAALFVDEVPRFNGAILGFLAG